MSRLTDPRLPDSSGQTAYVRDLVRFLTDYLRKIQTQLNGISEGAAEKVTNAATAAPSGSAQSYAVGDFVLNSAPSELGTAGSRYVIHGWQCVAAGAPGTWVQCRFLTGN
jgi:hypothetical protein